MRNALVLFDIDGTLINTGGAGSGAFIQTAQELFGLPDDLDFSFAGATDLGILEDLKNRFDLGFDLNRDDAMLAKFFDLYCQRLDAALGQETIEEIPGASACVRELESQGVGLGLVTGNARRSAMIKVATLGLEPLFHDGGFGDDNKDRNVLAELALGRCGGDAGLANHDVYLVGDTERDILAAKHIGAHAIGITGHLSSEELMDVGADHALCDVRELLPIMGR